MTNKIGSICVGNLIRIIYVLSIAVLAVYPVLPPLIEQWLTHNDYDYCLIVALLGVGVLAYRIKFVLSKNLEPSAYLFIPLVILLLLQSVLWVGRSEIGAQILVPPIIWLSLASVCGYRIAREFIAPICFLYFSIPVWDQLLPVLQKIAIVGSVYGMKMIGVSVDVTDNRINIPEGTFQVLYSCSGLRYLIAGVALTSFMTMVDRLKRNHVICLLLLTVFLSILFNWLRIIIVMYSGHITGMRHYFVSNNHKWLGEVLFVFLLIIVFFTENRFKKSTLGLSVSGNKATDSADVKIYRLLPDPANISKKNWVPIFMITLIFGAFNISLISKWKLVPDGTDSQLGAVPVMADRWHGPFKYDSAWVPEFLGPIDERRFSYMSDGQVVDVYMNIYGHQLQGKELVFDGNKITGPGNWQNAGYSFINHLESIAGMKAFMRAFRDSEGSHWVVGHLYSVGGLSTSSAFMAQFLYGVSALIKEKPAGIVAFAIKCDGDCDAELRMGDEFWGTMGSRLLAALPRSM